MKGFPSATMAKCPVRGVGFYADGCGETFFRTAAEAQTAADRAAQAREERALAEHLRSPDRVVVYADRGEVWTGGVLVRTEPLPDRRAMRRWVGSLPEYDSHVVRHVP